MKTLLKNIEYMATMNSDRQEITNSSILIEDNMILEVDCPNVPAEKVIDMRGKLVLPGFINTHHHLYQTLFRNIPAVASAELFDWLIFLYEKWKNIDNNCVYISALTGLYEMMSTGVTTSTDMLYLHPQNRNNFIDSEIEAAKRCGMRFHPTRGSMSLSKKDGGLPPDSVVQTEEEIIEDSIRLINKYHDRKKFAMIRIALAPCSPFSVTESSMIRTLEIAEEYDVLLHTHLAETKDEENFCMETKGYRPVDYMEKIGWLNPRVWFAHLVHLSPNDIDKLARTDSGMAHCPVSNMRLGSGVAPVLEMQKAGIRIGIAVDGSASNDSGNMLHEIRSAMLLQRVAKGAAALTPRDVLYMATMGGARVLRMNDYTGSIEIGKAADIIAFDLNSLGLAGSLSDPLASIVMCDPGKADFVMINGEVRVKDGQILESELSNIIEEQNKLSKKLISY